MSEIESVREMIGEFLQKQGVDATDALLEEDAWVFKRGSAAGHIVLIEDADEPQWSRVYVSYSIMKVPHAQAKTFYRRLLELNDSFGGMCSFSVDANDIVWLSAGRKTEGLDLSELEDLVMRAGFYADTYDDVLLKEFGSRAP